MAPWRNRSLYKSSQRAVRWRIAGSSAAALALTLVGVFSSSASVRAQETGTDNKLTTPLAVEWKYTGSFFGNNPASPVITKDTAYFVTGNRVFAVYTRNGSLKWRYPSDNTATLPSAAVVTPALNNGVLYVGAGDGLYAIGADDGKLHWHYSAQGGVDTTPTFLNEAVYFISGSGRIHAVNVQTGDSLPGVWKTGNSLGVDAGGGVAADAAVSNGIILYTTTNEVLHAIDLGTGVQRWYARPGTVDRNSVPVVTGESLTMVNGNQLSSWRMATGQRRWTVPLPGNALVPPVVDADGTAYVVTDNREIYAVNTRGRGVWKQPAKVEFVPLATPVLADNLLIVPTANGGIYAFDSMTGALRWNYMLTPTSTNINKIPDKVNVGASPVVVDGTLYVVSDDGALTAFRHDAPDSLPPMISDLEPTQGDYLNGRPPFHISAKVADEGSGLNLNTLTFKLDNRVIPMLKPGEEITNKEGFIFDPDINAMDYSTHESEGRSNALANGHHTATIAVKDWMGNQLTKSWSFYIDDTIPRKARKPNPNDTNRPGGPGGPGAGSGGIPGGGGGGSKGD